MVTYRAAEPPDDQDMRQAWLETEPGAPLSWPVQACFIAADTALRAYTERYGGGVSRPNQYPWDRYSRSRSSRRRLGRTWSDAARGNSG